jgi:hypothetical protein
MSFKERDSDDPAFKSDNLRRRPLFGFSKVFVERHLEYVAADTHRNFHVPKGRGLHDTGAKTFGRNKACTFKILIHMPIFKMPILYKNSVAVWVFII